MKGISNVNAAAGRDRTEAPGLDPSPWWKGPGWRSPGLKEQLAYKRAIPRAGLLLELSLGLSDTTLKGHNGAGSSHHSQLAISSSSRFLAHSSPRGTWARKKKGKEKPWFLRATSKQKGQPWNSAKQQLELCPGLEGLAKALFYAPPFTLIMWKWAKSMNPNWCATSVSPAPTPALAIQLCPRECTQGYPWTHQAHITSASDSLQGYIQCRALWDLPANTCFSSSYPDKAHPVQNAQNFQPRGTWLGAKRASDSWSQGWEFEPHHRWRDCFKNKNKKTQPIPASAPATLPGWSLRWARWDTWTYTRFTFSYPARAPSAWRAQGRTTLAHTHFSFSCPTRAPSTQRARGSPSCIPFNYNSPARVPPTQSPRNSP